jgi:hypothetical protein
LIENKTTMHYANFVLKDSGLLVQKYSGDFSMADYRKSIDELIGQKDFGGIKKILFDLRAINLVWNPQLISQLVSISKIFKKGSVCAIYITEKPIQVAIIHLYIKRLGNSCFGYCSTLEKAVAQLEVVENFAKINKVLHDL